MVRKVGGYGEKRRRVLGGKRGRVKAGKGWRVMGVKRGGYGCEMGRLSWLKREGNGWEKVESLGWEKRECYG